MHWRTANGNSDEPADVAELRRQLNDMERLAQIGCWSYDLNSKTLECSRGIFPITGLDPLNPPADLEAVQRIFHPSDFDRLRNKVRQSLKSGETIHEELRLSLPGRGMRNLIALADVERNAQGEPIRVFGMLQDVTQGRTVEESHKFLASILDQIMDCVTVTDLDGTVTWVNEAVVRLLGVPREELVGKSVEGYGHNREVGASQADVVRWTGKQGRWIGDVVNVCADGRQVLLETRTRLVFDDAGEPVAVCGVATDITQKREEEAARRRLEEQVRQSTKMEAIGQLAGGVAHDFNNLLQVMNACTELAQMELELEHPAAEHLKEVAAAGRRAKELVSQLLAFGRRQIMTPSSLDLNTVVSDLLRLLNRIIGEQIHLDFRPCHGAAGVLGDRGMMEQVVMNLCINARDAMPMGGTLTLPFEQMW